MKQRWIVQDGLQLIKLRGLQHSSISQSTFGNLLPQNYLGFFVKRHSPGPLPRPTESESDCGPRSLHFYTCTRRILFILTSKTAPLWCSQHPFESLGALLIGYFGPYWDQVRSWVFKGFEGVCIHQTLIWFSWNGPGEENGCAYWARVGSNWT